MQVWRQGLLRKFVFPFPQHLWNSKEYVGAENAVAFTSAPTVDLRASKKKKEKILKLWL